MARNPRRRHHRRHYRRNPGMLAKALVFPKVNQVLYVAGGFIAPPLIESQLNQFLPVTLTGNTIGKYAVRAAAILGLQWAVRSFVGRAEAFYVGLGGWSYFGISAIREFAPNLIPGMSQYTIPPSVRGQMAGYMTQARGLAAYAPNANMRLRGYTPPAAPAVGNPRAIGRFTRQ